MHVPNRRTRNLKKYNENHSASTAKKVIDATRFVFASIVFSLEFTAAAGFMILNNISPPSESAYYRAERNVVETLLKLAQESAKKKFDEMEDGTIISLDGSWGTKRNSRTFILDAIDITRKKIISFVLEDKDDKKNPYKGASNMMEAVAFKKMARILKASGKIKAIVKDGDTKIASIAKDIGWNVSFISDPQHLKKNFGTIFSKYNKEAGGKLRGLKNKIINHINYVLYCNKTSEAKKAIFLNIIQHFSGNHVNCTHDPIIGEKCKIIKDSKTLQIFEKLIKETAKEFGDFDPTLTSNYNENFHSIKARHLTKIIHLGYSWKGRIATAILQYNENYNWIAKAYNALHLQPLSATCILQFTKHIWRSLRKTAANNRKKNTQKEKDRRRKQQIAIMNQETNNGPEAHL